MARMSREFSLVLIGAGLLSAGFFFVPEPPTSKAPKTLRRARPNQKGAVRRVMAPPLNSDQGPGGERAAV